MEIVKKTSGNTPPAGRRLFRRGRTDSSVPDIQQSNVDWRNYGRPQKATWPSALNRFCASRALRWENSQLRALDLPAPSSNQIKTSVTKSIIRVNPRRKGSLRVWCAACCLVQPWTGKIRKISTLCRTAEMFRKYLSSAEHFFQHRSSFTLDCLMKLLACIPNRIVNIWCVH